jgi:hypothetical protein
MPLAIPHHHQRAETEAASALDHLGAAVHVHDAFREFRLAVPIFFSLSLTT